MALELVTGGLLGYSDLVTSGLGQAAPVGELELVTGGLLGYSDLVTGGLGQGVFAAPAEFTINGPHSGFQGVISTDFTITLDNPAQTDGVSCAISSTVGGDTITTTPFVIASGQTTGTFTLTPSTTGDRTISCTTTPTLTERGEGFVFSSVTSVTCVITSSVEGDVITTSPVVITSGTTGTFTFTPSTVGDHIITLVSTTPPLTIEGSPRTYTAIAAAGATGASMLMGF